MGGILCCGDASDSGLAQTDESLLRSGSGIVILTTRPDMPDMPGMRMLPPDMCWIVNPQPPKMEKGAFLGLTTVW